MVKAGEFMRQQMLAGMRWHMAAQDKRRRENAESRAACMANAGLVATLTEQAARRGQSEIDWTAYFRALDINYP